MAKGLIQHVTWRSTTLVLLETCWIVAAIALAAYVRLGAGVWFVIKQENGLLKALIITYVCQICLYYNDLYDDARISTDRGELMLRMINALGATSLLLAIIYYWFPHVILGRGVFAIAAVFMMIAVVSWRIGFVWLTGQVGPRTRLLLVGTSAAGVALARELHQRLDLGIEIVGFIDADPARVGERVFNPGVIGTFDEIPAIVRDRDIDTVVVSLSDARGKLPVHKLLEMRMGGVPFEHLADVYERYTGKVAVENLRPSWLLFSTGFQKSGWSESVKRAMDIVGSAIGLVLFAPILALLAVAIRVTSHGPALYHQRRVGVGGREFTVHKLRSMHQNAESGTGAVWARAGDVRVTRLGRFLRRTRLDEMPQLVNILRGEMSLVGPRPERPEFVSSLAEQLPFYGLRHVVKPGLTGWAQVRYTYGATVEDALEKLQYDLYYIKNFSLSLDVFIMFETVKTVLLRRGQ